MAASSTLKFTIEYLSSVQGISAVFSKGFQLEWSNDAEYFGSLKLDFLQPFLPLKGEAFFPVTAHGEKQVLSITPLFKGKYAISGYIFVLKNSYQVYQMAAKTKLSEYMNYINSRCLGNAEKLRELNDKIKTDLLLKKAPEELEKTVTEQGRYISALANDIEISKLIFIDEKNETNCNITDLVNILCNQLKEYYKSNQRRVTAQIDDKGYFNTLDFNILSLAVLQIVKFHTCTSPLKSGINISGGYFEKGMYGITVKTKKLPEGEAASDGMWEYYRSLAKKVFLYDFNGEFICDETDKYNITLAKFPVFKKNRGAIVALKHAGYLSDGFRPCTVVLKELVAGEIERLEMIKMEASKEKKLAMQDD
ncbi:MAG: hypothetical protein NC203_04080 [Firmicutes bacterium]|nr:hypothetical protein [[Eubacterium] siraeum]MCM1487527.1 hypothetical protein [Bacillota bacterium]